MRENIGADQIIFLRPPGIDGGVSHRRRHPGDPVSFEVLAADLDRFRIVVETIHRGVAEQGGGDGEDSGTASGVKQTFHFGIGRQAVDHFKAVEGGGVLPGAERHSRIDFQNFPAGFLLALQPARLDDQPVGDGDEVEILLPRLGPVLLFHLEGLERADPDAERFPLGNCGPEPFEIGGGALWILRVNGMDDARILPVLPAAEIKFQRGEHLRGQIEIAGLVADSDAIEHVVHDGSLPFVNGSARCLL
ncbi:MAG: hypothetical protein L6W00_19265 [Lentisphaeria bacterium]|nr:MAG: hypothetical protein L6W00_19265 [Lentisphaeria bacterium]